MCCRSLLETNSASKTISKLGVKKFILRTLKVCKDKHLRR